MEFRDINYFVVLAKHGHVGRAAESLGLSPPALSLSLKRLESTLRAKLFTRTPKGVELTTTGTALLAQVKRLQLAREDVLREVAGNQVLNTSTFRLASRERDNRDRVRYNGHTKAAR